MRVGLQHTEGIYTAAQLSNNAIYRHQRQRGVLGAADPDRSVEWPAAANSNLVHGSLRSMSCEKEASVTAD